jgi:hypothetical protein
MSLTIRLEHPTIKQLHSINEELSKSKLPPYIYNKNLVPIDIKFPDLSWSSVDRHYYENLKIIAAKLWQDPSWITDTDFRPYGDRNDSEVEFMTYLLAEAMTQDKSHLICLNRYTGRYIPVDFGSSNLPLWSIGCCGSSVNLCRELEFIASSLKFDLDRHHPYLARFKEWSVDYEQEIDIIDNGDILMSEKRILCQLYNIASLSIKYNLIVVFN